MAVEAIARNFSNKRRAAHAEFILQSFLTVIESDDIADTAEELIESIGHWCDRNDLSFRELIERALQGWNTNKALEQGADPSPLHIEVLTTDERNLREFERGEEISSAIENALAREREVTLPEEFGHPGIPDEWFEKPFCRIAYGGDAGDPSVGIPAWYGYVLADDQDGTIVGEMIDALAVDALR